ncbi:hypothetical protein ACFYU8_18055 [Brevibacillus sp. NPDC003359]|uniref:hypothetical protein n=1 Tax=unclassified Brevibacillus TaxID=2684853 RepID=UPI00367535AB
MQLQRGTTYWGYIGTQEVHRRVNLIETRSSGKEYVNWTQKKKDGTEGQTRWTELGKFKDWVKGIFEIGDAT